MKPLEEIFFKACVHEDRRHAIKSIPKEFYPREIVNIFSRLGFPHKQLWYYLEKWANLGFYNYGVTLDLGWFELEKLPAKYLRLYTDVVNAVGVTDWDNTELLEYLAKSKAKHKDVEDFATDALKVAEAGMEAMHYVVDALARISSGSADLSTIEKEVNNWNICETGKEN